MRSGWKYEGWRHSLAAKGIRSYRAKKAAPMSTPYIEVYHGTDKESAKSIMKYGLMSQERRTGKGQPFSYGTVDAEAARDDYADRVMESGKEPVVLRVRVPRSQVVHHPFPSSREENIAIRGTVDPKYITEVSSAEMLRKVEKERLRQARIREAEMLREKGVPQ